MEIMQAEDTLVCTNRSFGLQHMSLRVLRDRYGKFQVAVDPVGVRKGNWVYTMSGSAARYATGNFEILTDLTIGGIIDFWEAENERSTGETATG